jgi:hypothetical protein
MCDHYPTPSQKFLTVIISIVVIIIGTLPDKSPGRTERNRKDSSRIPRAGDRPEEWFLRRNLEGIGPGNGVLMVMHRHQQRTCRLIQGIFYARGIDWVDGDSSRCGELKVRGFGRGGD